jgi:hypothetical protein
MDEKFQSVLDEIKSAQLKLAHAEAALLNGESPYINLTKVIRRAQRARTDWHTIDSMPERS